LKDPYKDKIIKDNNFKSKIYIKLSILYPKTIHILDLNYPFPILFWINIHYVLIGLTEKLEDITEEETKMILDGITDDKLVDSLSKKLKMFIPSNADKALSVIKRNLGVLIQ